MPVGKDQGENQGGTRVGMGEVATQRARVWVLEQVPPEGGAGPRCSFWQHWFKAGHLNYQNWPWAQGARPPGGGRFAQVHDSRTTESLKVPIVGKKDEKKGC